MTLSLYFLEFFQIYTLCTLAPRVLNEDFNIRPFLWDKMFTLQHKILLALGSYLFDMGLHGIHYNDVIWCWYYSVMLNDTGRHLPCDLVQKRVNNPILATCCFSVLCTIVWFLLIAIIFLKIEAPLFRSSHCEFLTAIMPDVIPVCCEEHIYINAYMYFM